MSQEDGEENNNNFESQQSMAIPPASEVEETSAHPEDGSGKKKDKRGHRKYLVKNVSRRMTLLSTGNFPKLASKYASGDRAGQKIKWHRATRVKHLHKYGVGRGAVGTVIPRPRIKRGLKDIRDANMPILASFVKAGKRLTFQAGAIDTAVRAADVFFHNRTADAKQIATSKYGDTRTVTEYDARRAWAIASGDGGRHLADIPFTAKDGAQPAHKKSTRGGGKRTRDEE